MNKGRYELAVEKARLLHRLPDAIVFDKVRYNLIVMRTGGDNPQWAALYTTKLTLISERLFEAESEQMVDCLKELIELVDQLRRDNPDKYSF